MQTNILEIENIGMEMRATTHLLEFSQNENALILLDPQDVSTPFQITLKFLEEFEKKGFIIPSQKESMKEQILTFESGKNLVFSPFQLFLSLFFWKFLN